jgi:hypothetical protein
MLDIGDELPWFMGIPEDPESAAHPARPRAAARAAATDRVLMFVVMVERPSGK